VNGGERGHEGVIVVLLLLKGQPENKVSLMSEKNKQTKPQQQRNSNSSNITAIIVTVHHLTSGLEQSELHMVNRTKCRRISRSHLARTWMCKMK
jgi:hypothetical protein